MADEHNPSLLSRFARQAVVAYAVGDVGLKNLAATFQVAQFFV